MRSWKRFQAGDPAHLREELGDLLLQIVLNAQVAKDHGEFDIQDVARGINEKMIKRHPHVFSDADLSTPGAVSKHWNELKDEERKGQFKSAMDGVPQVFPALLQALRSRRRLLGRALSGATKLKFGTSLPVR